MIECPHFIDGRPVWSRSGETFTAVNPATGKALARVAFGEMRDVDDAVVAAWRSFDEGSWRHLPPPQRAFRLRALASAIRADAERLAEAESADTGKPIRFARGDVAGTAELLDYFATLPENVRGAVFADSPGYFAHSRREPYGVVAAIAPWNFPLMNAVWKTCAALAVGNSIVLKMAEQTPVTTTMLAELTVVAGLPAGVFNVVHGDGPVTGAALVSHPRVPKITFTGSTDVGRSILHAAAEGIKSVHLELGGKTSNVLFADANLDEAIEGSLFTGFFNSGQICTAGTRLLVEEAIADDVLECLSERLSGLKVGDPRAEGTHLGPLISGEQRDRVEFYVKDGIASGARVVFGGGRPVGVDKGGYFVQPTVLADVRSKMRVDREEIFGPVVTLTRFSDAADAVAKANSVDYGLAATVWTNDLRLAMETTDQLDAGIIWTNCPHHLVWGAPYEGHKVSGLGEDLGLEVTNTFTQLKTSYMRYAGEAIGWS